jgi:ubiquinone/menaquinone biosynthesis C-methylase UbiE
MLSRVKAYYDRRAAEYDDWYRGTGLFAHRARPGWEAELDALCEALAALPPARTLDVACGTGFLTRHLPGQVTGLDQSAAMLAIARDRIPGGHAVQGDALRLPFPDRCFERVAAGHFYGHLEPADRARFLAEAGRVGGELLVTDSARRPGVPAERWDPRVLSDGSEHVVFKRWFEPATLLSELGGGEVVHAGTWFVAVRSP